MRDDGTLLVLDVHGVVLTNPLRPFLAEVARRRGRDPERVLAEWTGRLRRRVWLGRIDEAGLWEDLFPGCDPDALTAELEERYRPGPLAPALGEIEGPIWLLSNHRSGWLHPRLERFGLADRFERVLVSDAIGHVKPDAGAFRVVRIQAGDRRIRYVDDTPANVIAAGEVFEESFHLGEVSGPRLRRAV